MAGTISQLAADGQVVGRGTLLTNDAAGGNAVAENIAADSMGNVIMAGTYKGTLHYKTGQGDNQTLSNTAGATNGFVLKVLLVRCPGLGRCHQPGTARRPRPRWRSIRRETSSWRRRWGTPRAR